MIDPYSHVTPDGPLPDGTLSEGEPNAYQPTATTALVPYIPEKDDLWDRYRAWAAVAVLCGGILVGSLPMFLQFFPTITFVLPVFFLLGTAALVRYLHYRPTMSPLITGLMIFVLSASSYALFWPVCFVLTLGGMAMTNPGLSQPDMPIVFLFTTGLAFAIASGLMVLMLRLWLRRSKTPAS